jgi:hypothetical protein
MRAKPLIPSNERGFCVVRVSNGWAIYGNQGPYDFSVDRTSIPLGVARSAEELASYVHEWAFLKEEEAAKEKGE